MDLGAWPRRSTSCPNPIFDEEDIPRPIAAFLRRTDTKTMTPSTEPAAPAPKATFAYAIATVFGTGFLKPVPGHGDRWWVLIAVVSHPSRGFAPGKGIEVAIGKTAPLDNPVLEGRCALVPSFLPVAFSGLARCAQAGRYSEWSE